MPSKPAFDELVAEALAAPIEGWDLSWLKGKRTEFTLPWDYCARVRAAMKEIASMLDMGTGGGEILSSMAPFPSQTFATEAYLPNVAIARRRLEPLGVDVYDTSDDPENQHLPFKNDTFDLVVNRHESFISTEVHRILRPGGRFITQQCGGYGEVNLIEFFRGKIEPMDWTAGVASRQLADAGFEIINAQEVYPEYSILDIRAVVYTFRVAAWMLGDFTVEKYRDRLLDMHQYIEEHGSFEVKDQRFFVEATRP